MRVIKTMADISLLRKAGALNPELIDEVEKQLKEVFQNLGGDDLGNFSLKDVGPIVVLEAGDNVRDLAEIGLNPKDGGLLGAPPEWADTLEIGGEKTHVMVVVINNEYALSVFCPANVLDEKAAAALDLESY
ncbi:hypothetical protein [Desulfallas thermosapovorans]|uniref:Uncharacterized protein n=1 Tax=Desulfallas thermosapovorans DSM 6562 TaxID=1121431 RepID=A0A5S4ZRS4_9FIRM|nr:hypothetical protein [Desulfallas thermosapovorans]TYO95505.1 hypothetical protein LX24_01466 [Desulfallas thermosapovorans DSM 6562]